MDVAGHPRRLRPRRILVALFAPCFSLAVFVLALEVGLRLVPGAIPDGLLADFQSEIRGAIARERGLPTNDDVQLLERTDGGPPLRLWKPHARLTRVYRDAGWVPTAEVDEIGFPNPPGLSERAAFDIVAIGDSFTFCTGVRLLETWPHQLAEITGSTVLNLGKGNIGPYEYLEILRRFGLSKKPRVVVMNLYEGNDLRDAWRYHRYREGGGRESGEGSKGVLTALLRRSYAVNLLGTLAESIFSSVTPPEVDFRYQVALGSGEKIVINGENADLDEVATARSLASGELDFRLMKEALVEFVSLSREHGFRPIVTYSPSAYSAYEATVSFEDPALHDLMPGFSRDQRAWLERASERHGFEFLDLTPALQEHAARSDVTLYFPTNLHYSQAGHRAVAEILAESIE